MSIHSRKFRLVHLHQSIYNHVVLTTYISEISLHQPNAFLPELSFVELEFSVNKSRAYTMWQYIYSVCIKKLKKYVSLFHVLMERFGHTFMVHGTTLEACKLPSHLRLHVNDRLVCF